MSADVKTEQWKREALAPRDVEIILPETFALDSGEQLTNPVMRIRLQGQQGGPVIAIAGGISAGRDVVDSAQSDGWWREIAGPNGFVDTEQCQVLGFDFLPNETEQARTLTTHDQARALAYALSVLKIDTLDAFIGASYGGMVALAFAETYPDQVARVIVVSASDKPHPFGTAFRGVQRRILEMAGDAGRTREGVALARQLAMISYRSADEFSARFDHEPGDAAGDPSSVCEYLIARGSAFRMSPERYLTLSDSIDRHSVLLSRIRARALFIAVKGDQLSPPSDIRRCASAVEKARYVEIFSQYGHDAFLKEAATIGPFITQFLKES